MDAPIKLPRKASNPNIGSNSKEMQSPLSCFRCGVCCMKFQAPCTPEEVVRIAGHLQLAVDVFFGKYVDPRWPGKEKLLLHAEGKCPFLTIDASGKIKNCSIHQVRPAACRDWSPGTEKRECRDGLAQIWQLSIDESGNLLGSKQQITAFTPFLQSLKNG